VTAVGALVLDQVSKTIARSALEFNRTVELVQDFFGLRLTENPGAAFGALGSWPPILILVGLAAVLVIVGLRKERSKSRVLAVALGLLLGGTLGNLIDRVRFSYVTDFLDFTVRLNGRNLSWPTFNLADVAITVGVALLVYHAFFVEAKLDRKKS
jgi:signal peptidase II